ncbi:WYL domain-containing protein [Roseicella aerolata]|uniref:WYL domain-containing protein n=1 Tax=Roseicella aerolata TaxID=2883479 RepID=A0A9X1I8S9_9PROT|nr:WYL domain-containing protein [Roseicella aerolata]MCB4820294.1 WYL domain-containing protein [Roseicella aerolata]
MPDHDVAALLADAVHQRRAVQLLYDGAWRVVHPHALGRTGRGKLSLLAWQTAGLGRSAEPEGWRMFDLTRVAGADLLQAHFAPRPQPASGRWTAGIAEPMAAV